MRKIITIGMVLLPCMAFANTDCRVINYPDHYEAVCIGDEKAPLAPAQQTAPPQVSATITQPVVTAPSQASVTSQAAETAGKSLPSQMPATRGAAIMHRQGRQQYQKGMEEAKAARMRLIMELQQGQAAP